MSRFHLMLLLGVGAVLGLIACHSGLSGGAPAEGAKPTKIPALQLPRAFGGPGPPRDFVWAEGVAEAASMYFPDEMPVFTVISATPKDTAVAVVALFGQSLAPDSDEYATDPADPHTYLTAISEAGDTVGIEAFADGNYSVRWRSRHPLRALRKWDDQAPGVSETAAVAQEFLDQHPGMLPDAARLVQVVPIGINSGPDSTGRLLSFVRTRGAVFRRFHNGFPEGQFTVMVNSNGEVCNLSRNMRDLALVGDYPILTPAEAEGLLNSPGARNHGLQAVDIVGPARIEAVEMEYWDGALAWEMGSIQPVYNFTGTVAFSGTVEGATGGRAKWTVTVPAVRPEYTEPPPPS
jgi:hypothetical protein